MKIVQIENGFVHWDASKDVPDLNWALTHYSTKLHFVEAPDFVREGFSFDENADGDARFIEPEPPEGWLYDKNTGTFYQEGSPSPSDQLSAYSIAKNIINKI